MRTVAMSCLVAVAAAGLSLAQAPRGFVEAARLRLNGQAVKGTPAQEREVARRQADVRKKLGDKDEAVVLAFWAVEERWERRLLRSASGAKGGMGNARAPEGKPGPKGRAEYTKPERKRILSYGIVPFVDKDLAAEVIARFYVMSPFDYGKAFAQLSSPVKGTKRRVQVDLLGRYPANRDGTRWAKIAESGLNPCIATNLQPDDRLHPMYGRFQGVTIADVDGGHWKALRFQRPGAPERKVPAGVTSVRVKIPWNLFLDFDRKDRISFGTVGTTANAVSL